MLSQIPFLRSMTLCLMLATAVPSAMADTEDSFNIRFSPLGLALGMANARFDFKVAPQVTVGPSFFLWNIDIGDINIRASGVGVDSTYYFNEAFTHSPFINGGLNYLHIKAEDDFGIGSGTTAELSALQANIIGGYHWFWGSSFNLAVGGGLTFNTIGEIETKDSSGTVTDREDYSPVGLALMAELGFTF